MSLLAVEGTAPCRLVVNGSLLISLDFPLTLAPLIPLIN
jgi:hypothetical protein